MDTVFILARTLSDGKLWQALRIGNAPKWTWIRAPESNQGIMGHLVLSVSAEADLPSGPGSVTSDMLPGVTGEGVTHA